jgi:hypothetical protein
VIARDAGTTLASPNAAGTFLRRAPMPLAPFDVYASPIDSASTPSERIQRMSLRSFVHVYQHAQKLLPGVACAQRALARQRPKKRGKRQDQFQFCSFSTEL